MLRSLDLGVPELGAVIAALLGERDIIRQGPDGPVVQSTNIMLRLRVLAVHTGRLRLPPRPLDGNGKDKEKDGRGGEGEEEEGLSKGEKRGGERDTEGTV